VLDVLAQSKRNKRAALKLMHKLLKKYGFMPDKLVTDDLKSYTAAVKDFRIARPLAQQPCRELPSIHMTDESRKCRVTFGYEFGLFVIALSAIIPIIWFKWRGWVVKAKGSQMAVIMNGRNSPRSYPAPFIKDHRQLSLGLCKFKPGAL
jgi:hypothetical protein